MPDNDLLKPGYLWPSWAVQIAGMLNRMRATQKEILRTVQQAREESFANDKAIRADIKKLSDALLTPRVEMTPGPPQDRSGESK